MFFVIRNPRPTETVKVANPQDVDQWQVIGSAATQAEASSMAGDIGTYLIVDLTKGSIVEAFRINVSRTAI